MDIIFCGNTYEELRFLAFESCVEGDRVSFFDENALFEEKIRADIIVLDFGLLKKNREEAIFSLFEKVQIPFVFYNEPFDFPEGRFESWKKSVDFFGKNKKTARSFLEKLSKSARVLEEKSKTKHNAENARESAKIARHLSLTPRLSDLFALFYTFRHRSVSISEISESLSLKNETESCCAYTYIARLKNAIRAEKDFSLVRTGVGLYRLICA